MADTSSVFKTPWGEGRVEAAFEEKEEQAQARAEAASQLLEMFGDNYFASLGALDIPQGAAGQPVADEGLGMAGMGYDPGAVPEAPPDEEEE